MHKKINISILIILLFGCILNAQHTEQKEVEQAKKEETVIGKLELKKQTLQEAIIIQEKIILNEKREKDKVNYQSQEAYNAKKYEAIKAEQLQQRFSQEQEQEQKSFYRPQNIFKDSKEEQTTTEFRDNQTSEKMVAESIFESAFENIINNDKLEIQDENYEKENSQQLRGPSQYDSRVEAYQLNPDIDWQFYMLLVSKSVGMIVEKDKLIKISKDSYQLDTRITLKSKFNLCNNIAFSNQSIVGTGTAFIYTDNSMLTANHVFQTSVENYAVVFGFEIINANGVTETIINASDVYFPKKITKSSTQLDVALFEVDRNFTNHAVLQTGISRQLTINNEIYMVGYPSGLPKKLAVNAGIIQNNHPQYFYTSLDSFQGNSGSPVIDFNTHKVIGVLVSGETDYIFNGNCNELNSCALPYCKGEKVIRIEEIINQF